MFTYLNTVVTGFIWRFCRERSSGQQQIRIGWIQQM
uniref:Uncharacterized protein n=1 Tax=Anguilla anguilla TaxID=7936 RepID=A0A0E9PVM6_ANGAN